jgi:hypothetical protein
LPIKWFGFKKLIYETNSTYRIPVDALEFIGQRLNDNQKSFLDIAPSVQFIFNSQARVDIGYRRQLYSTMERTAPNGMVLKFEYLLFNVFK